MSLSGGRILSRLRLDSGEVWFEATCQNGQFTLDWTRAGRARLAKQGRLLRFRPRLPARSISIQILRRIVRAYAKSLQGREALHATALVKKGKVLALIGPSGEGKSTLAAYLLKSDPSTRLLTDDLLYVRVRKDQAWILPYREVSRLKLFKEIAKRFGFGNSEFDPNLEKEIVPFPSRNGNSHPLNLVGIIQLCRGRNKTRLRLQRLKGARAALTLLANIYNEILRPPRVLKNQFELCTRVSRVVPLWRLTFPSGFKALPAVAPRLNRIWTG